MLLAFAIIFSLINIYLSTHKPSVYAEYRNIWIYDLRVVHTYVYLDFCLIRIFTFTIYSWFWQFNEQWTFLLYHDVQLRWVIFVWFCKHSAYCISGDIYSWFIQLILWRFLLINVMKYTYLQRLHLSFVVVIVVSVYQGKSVISCCCSYHCCCCCCFKCVCLTINSNPLLLLLFHCLDYHHR